MAGNVSIRNYKGLYTVEFSSQSLGCTLIATWDKSEAEAEYERFKNMTESEMIDYLNGVSYCSRCADKHLNADPGGISGEKG